MADDRERETDRTTIIRSDGDGRGNPALILVVALIVILLAVLFFAGVFDRGDERDINVDTPDVNVIVPQTQVPVVQTPELYPPPDVNVNVTTPPPLPEENLGNTTIVNNSG